MAANIDIITEGYARMVELTGNERQSKSMRATGSCCLVRSNGDKILFDTMGPWEKGDLIEKLAKLNIHPDDIDVLVCSHSHPDHVGNLNLFTKARRHIIGTSVYQNDVYDLNCFEPTGNYTYKSSRGSETNVIVYHPIAVNQNVSIEPSPGHTLECVKLIVNNCDKFGSIGLAGDLFECEQDIADEGIWLAAGSQNPDLQRAHRMRLYKQVDYILPGHGALFKTGRDICF